ncbi:MAG: Ig-like domain-containing protein, partial [Acidimicrobiales bacterium]
TLNADGSFTYTPEAGFSGTDSFTYTASDGNGGTDTATVTITVTAAAASADLAVSIADLPATVNSRSELSVTITVRNNGPDPAQVSLLVTPTRGIRFLEAQGASCIVQKGKVKALSCDLGSMASGAQTTVTLLVKNPSKPQTATLAAMVSSPTGDPVLTNNMASESYAIQRP